MNYLHLLDLIGVFAFALYGARTALHAKFDLFGIWLCGFLTALGGGAIREIILNQQPVFFHDYTYILVASLGCAAAIAVHQYFKSVEKYVLLLDTIGLVTFAYIGATRADEMGLGVVPIILFALLTAVGGGILADLVAGRKPESLYKDAYPLAPLCLAIAYCVWRPVSGIDVALLLGGTFLLRLLFVWLDVRVWAPHAKVSRLAGGGMQRIYQPVRAIFGMDRS